MPDAEVLAAIDHGPAVIYKHSHRCALSHMVQREIGNFQSRHPDVPVLWIDAVRRRTLSRAVAYRLGIRHESPQAIVVSDGEAFWSASHMAVTASALERAVGALRARRGTTG